MSSAGVGENLQVGILGYTKIVQHVGQQVMMGKVILNPFTVQRAWGAGLGRVWQCRGLCHAQTQCCLK